MKTEEMTKEQLVLAARQRREVQRLKKEQAVQEAKRRQKQELQIVLWVTAGIFLGIPLLVFLVPGEAAATYIAAVILLTFHFPILPLIWLAVMCPLALYFKKRDKSGC